ncbi:hypothetical protein GEMRC1_000206 [Eukaryota sp. GEM-RC1]
MSLSLLPAETLSCILTDPSFSDQTISFGEESIEVNKTVLAASSSYFHSLWFLEFGDKLDNPIDFSHLGPFTLTDSNVYHFFYLIHYFQVNKLIDQFEKHLNTHLVTWAWLKPFIEEANERNDLRALEFVGPFFSKIDDLVIDDVMAITTEGFQSLVKYCTSSQSLSWFIKSLVSSIINQNFDLNVVPNILNSCSVEALSLQQWKEYLFVPLKHVKELETELMKFSFKRVNVRCVDFLLKENSDLVSEIAKLQSHIQQLKKSASETQLAPKHIKMSQTRKSSLLQVSDDRKRVVLVETRHFHGEANILGEDPLLPGNVYTWKVRYQGTTEALFVGVIDESKFRVDGDCYRNAHGVFNGRGNFFGCLSGNNTRWNLGELLEINANLINYTLTIKSVSNSSLNVTGTLPRLSRGHYYIFASMCYDDHGLEIVE